MDRGDDAMSIFPLPVFEADADPHHRTALSDEEIYDRLEPPKSIVVRFGRLYQVAEYAYDGDAKPGCGTRLVARTHRGTEVVEMLTTTCENAGCTKSVTRQEMREYIDASGGKDYPFATKGRVLRVATIEDLNRQSALDQDRPRYVRACKETITELGLDMTLVEVEPILGGELLTFYYMSEKRVDFRELVRRLAAEFKTRIEMRQVGARDEARLVADYERCGQHCCCKNFLKVLKPVSMKSAKLQKATLDPLKISGRCGRLMCCLRYEDQTYRELKQNLPHKATRVGTTEGPGVVVDTKVLVQLVLVRLEESNREVAVPVEELMDPEKCPKPGEVKPAADPMRGMPAERVRSRVKKEQRAERTEPAARQGRGKEDGEQTEGGGRRKRRRRRGSKQRQDEFRSRSESGEKQSGAGEGRDGKRGGRPPRPAAGQDAPPGGESSAGAGAPKRRRRRRRRGRGGGGDKPSGGGGGGGGGGNPSTGGGEG